MSNSVYISLQTTREAVEKLRTNLWDEENRLRAVGITPDAEGIRPIAIYTYDAGGERVLKHSNTSVSIYLNGKKVADTIQVDATLYPSGMLVAKLGSNGSEEEEQTLAYTKHYYAGTQRVSSKIGTTENLGEFLQDWFTGGIGGPVDVVGSSFGVLENAEEGVIQVYDELGIEAPTYDSSRTFIPVQSFVHGDDENEIYWFHPDHLGSTSYISNILGEVSQHMEYFAFGEMFVEEHRSSNNSPYKFNDYGGKSFEKAFDEHSARSAELDEETGWYYYGARYYDPRVSIWLSVDPMANVDYIMNKEAYINGEHNAGVFNSFNHNSYGYCYQNPIRYMDPNGKQSEISGDPGGMGGNGSFCGNFPNLCASVGGVLVAANDVVQETKRVLKREYDYLTGKLSEKDKLKDYKKDADQLGESVSYAINNWDETKASFESTWENNAGKSYLITSVFFTMYQPNKVKGASIFGKCADFAKDFSKKHGGVIYKINVPGAGFSVLKEGKDVGLGFDTHQFVLKNIDGKDYIFDNMNPERILKDNYVKGLPGQKDGKIISGDTLFKGAKKVE